MTTLSTVELFDLDMADLAPPPVSALTDDQQTRLKAARDYAALVTQLFKQRPPPPAPAALASPTLALRSDGPSHDGAGSNARSVSPRDHRSHHQQEQEQSRGRRRRSISGSASPVARPAPGGDRSPSPRDHDRYGRSPRNGSPATPLGRSGRSRSPGYYGSGGRRQRAASPPGGSYHGGRGRSRSPPGGSGGSGGYQSRGGRSRSPGYPPPRGGGRSRSPYYGRGGGRSRSPPPPPRGGGGYYGRRYSRSPPPAPPPRRGGDRKPAALVVPVINRTINRIYVGNISSATSKAMVRAAFARYGWIKEVSFNETIEGEPHKGWCFIEYDCPEAAMGAIDHLNAADMDGRVLKVNHTNAFAPDIWRYFAPKVPSRIYYANVYALIDEEDMRELFEPFGELVNFSLCPDILTHRHKGYGFAEYTDEASAQSAIKHLNHLPISIMLESGETVQELLMVAPTLVGGLFPEGMRALSRFPYPRFDPPPLPMGPKPVLPRVIPEPPSAVLLMRNMIGPTELDEYFKEDVEEECGKHGKVLDVVVHVNPGMNGAAMAGTNLVESGVRVFVQYSAVEEREKAFTVMNGRFFGGRQVVASEYSQIKFAEGSYDM
ncbi:hypothetical protein BC828DRAFT_381161 [Blastocladiella britannica]|nr:hypothetical protein BC828DRAFT_381161 [Blastocladiella britannica]